MNGVGIGVYYIYVVCIPPLTVFANAINLLDLYAANTLPLTLLNKLNALLPSLPASTSTPLITLYAM